jgi:hypothetical protein
VVDRRLRLRCLVGGQDPGILSIRHDSSDSLRAAAQRWTLLLRRSDPLMPRVTIHVGGPEPLRTAGIHGQPMDPIPQGLAVLIQLSTASRRNADREGRSVPEAIMSP